MRRWFSAGVCFSVSVLLAACASGADDGAEADDSALTLGELKGLVDTFGSVRARRPFGATDEMAKAFAVPDARSVCASSTDPVCADLVRVESQPIDGASGSWAKIRDTLHARVTERGAGPVGDIVSSDAFRYWVRERVVALTAYYAAQGTGQAEVKRAGVDQFLSVNYPLYSAPSDFHLARTILPPSEPASCTEGHKTDAVIIIPGVLRTQVPKEFGDQLAIMSAAFPCVDVRRVDFGSFDDPDTRLIPAIRKVVNAIDSANGPVPLHFVGYSQGVATAIRTLAQDKAIAARTRTVLAMNGAAHGSEAADFAVELVSGLAGCEASLTCGALHSQGLKILFEQFFKVSLSGDNGSDQLKNVLKEKRLGMDSLTTAYAQKFWAGQAKELPKNAPNTLFYTFRSGLTRTEADPKIGNLPEGQVALYNLISDRGGASPWNDMQVRVVNHALGGPVAAQEVVSRVAEGNHWQWQLKRDETLPQMEEEMVNRMPKAALFHAYFRTLAELGLLASSQ